MADRAAVAGIELDVADGELVVLVEARHFVRGATRGSAIPAI